MEYGKDGLYIYIAGNNFVGKWTYHKSRTCALMVSNNKTIIHQYFFVKLHSRVVDHTLAVTESLKLLGRITKLYSVHIYHCGYIKPL